MVSDDPSTSVNESNVAAESTVGGKKNQSRVPKKIHKAEREKLKRDQLNELFLEVATERNELKDENTTLQAEISQLQKELQGRSRSNPTWSDNINSIDSHSAATDCHRAYNAAALFRWKEQALHHQRRLGPFPGDKTTCQISNFVGLAAGSSPLDFSPGSQEQRCGGCGISTSSEEEGCNKASTGISL